MAKGKQGRAAKAARYRAATGDASQLARGRHQNQNQNTLSHFLTRAPTNHGQPAPRQTDCPADHSR